MNYDFIYKCSKCDYKARNYGWLETKVSCDLCGNHLAYECPQCSKVYEYGHDSRGVDKVCQTEQPKQVDFQACQLTNGTTLCVNSQEVISLSPDFNHLECSQNAGSATQKPLGGL